MCRYYYRSNTSLSSSDSISSEAAGGIVNGIPENSSNSQDKPDTGEGEREGGRG